MNKLLMLVLILILYTVSASAQSVISTAYGDGWQTICYSDGKCSHSNVATYLRWDNTWQSMSGLNINNGNWSYTVLDTGTKINFTADGRTISIPKANTKFNLELFKISPSLTYSKTTLINNMVNVPSQITFDNITYPANTLAYLTFPYSVSQIKDYADENNINFGRWRFQAGKEHIDIFDDVKVNHTYINMTGQNETYFDVTILNKSAYAFKIINDEIRIYFVKSEANKMSGNITFELKSWTVGEGANAWSGNSTYSNFALDRNTNHIILPDAVTDGLVLYHKMSGSSGITSYDMNLTSNNNGTLTGMNTGLDNGTSGWNSSGCKFNNCLSFNGNTSYINIGNNFLSSNVSDFSVFLYIKGNPQFNKHIVSKYYSDINHRSFEIGTGYYNTSQIAVVISDTGGINNRKVYESSISPLNNIVNYIGFVFHNSTLKLYINGVEDINVNKTLDQPLSYIFGTNEDAFIGAQGLPVILNLFKGTIDEVRIYYNRSLTSNEINQIMNNTMLASENLTTWYNAGTGNETYQITVNATTDANSNYTVWYAENGTSSYTQLGGTLTGNNTLPIEGLLYQNTDVQVRLAGNTTSTPEIISVTFWTESTIVPLSCGNLDVDGKYYTLTQNVSSVNTTCFTIKANNITLDGKGYTISHSSNGITDSYGVNATGYNNLTFENLNIVQNGTAQNTVGIWLQNSNNSLIQNNTIQNLYGNIWVESTSSSIIRNNNLNSGYGYGIYFMGGYGGSANSTNNVIENNTINVNDFGIALEYRCYNNTIIYNNVQCDDICFFIDLWDQGLGNGYNNISNNYMTGYTQLFDLFSSGNIVKDNILVSTLDTVYIYLAKNNMLENNTIISDSGVALKIHYYSNNNTISNGSIISNSGITYSVSQTNTTSIRQTNWTIPRTIRLYDNTSQFNYTDDNNVWLNTKSITSTAITTRAILNWTQTNISWSETLSVTGKILNYSLRGLLPDTTYYIYNDTVIDYTYITDLNGVLTPFTINFTIYPRIITVTSELPLLDTSFTVSLPSGITQAFFNASNKSSKNVNANGQNSSTGFLYITNTGNVAEDFYAIINSSQPAGVALKGSTDNNPAGESVVPIDDSLTKIIDAIPVSESQYFWLWVDYSNASPMAEQRVLSVNSSQ